jgi:hypothetical protein
VALTLSFALELGHDGDINVENGGDCAITTVGNDGLNVDDSRERRSKPLIRLAKQVESL